MFTGIIEGLGKIHNIKKEGSNSHFFIESDISSELKIDQSLSHDGICLTVVSINNNIHQVTAVQESINKTNLSTWAVGRQVNLERCVHVDGRLDGHFVQGHVDRTTTCVDIKSADGSWYFTFNYEEKDFGLLVEQGSISINGVSLTIARLTDKNFTVAVIPYTFEHTTFGELKINDPVNLEFDIIGKYIRRNLNQTSPSVV